MDRQGGGRAQGRHRRRQRVNEAHSPGTGEAARALFDEAFYRRAAGLNGEADAFAHYLRQGEARGLKPNAVFEPRWYLSRHPEAAALGPLRHYAEQGEAQDGDPSPLFDVAWYRRAYGAERPLAHYLTHRFGPFSPVPEFDAAFYLKTYPDVGAAGLDPFQHYLLMGFREFRLPYEGFEPRLYALRRMGRARGQNPIAHMRAHPGSPRIELRQAGGPQAQVRAFTRRGPAFEPPEPARAGEKPRALVLAFHLPQFHAIPENDAWWGAGYTEWTALARGQPRFAGHYQPRIPGQLGFYDLGDPATLKRQAALARGAGIGGFVFYHYDFGGKRLLQTPVDLLLATPDIDIGFCLMWANENWTRRWDGAVHEVLLRQDYSPAHEDARLADFARHFRDPRYLRLQGRPVLMVYRASLIPDTAATILRWRRLFSQRHGETPIFVMAQTFDDADPRPPGFDAALEFPPHKLTRGLPQVFDRLEVFDEGFEADVYAYDHLVDASLSAPAPDFPLIKTAVPSWDNDARLQGLGLTLAGSTPTKFGRWLDALIERAAPAFGARIVAINAWNEWSEAACLEPDVHFGAAYLNAAARAIHGRAPARQSLATAGGPAATEWAHRLAAAFGFALASGDDAAMATLGLGDTPAEIAGLRAQGLHAVPAPFGPAPADADAQDRQLRAWLGESLPHLAKVSVFVVGAAGPRLASLFAQTHPVWELIVLGPDDAALDAAEATAHSAGRDLMLMIDEAAAASPAAAIKRAAAMASGDFVWIVEASGRCAPDTLARLVAPLTREPRLAFAFTQTRALNAAGRPVYARPSPLDASRRPLFDGDLDAETFADAFGEAPAAALWRRDALHRALDAAPGTQPGPGALMAEALNAPARAAFVAEDLEFSG